jgi:hypothetical protein
MVNHEPVSCERVWREISNYVDGGVDPALRSAMEEHFRTCPRCTSVLAGIRNVVQLYGDDRMLEVPSGFGRRLEKRLVKDAGVKGRAWSSWSAWLVPVAAMALIVGGYKLTTAFTFHRPAKSILAVPPNNIPPELKVVVSNGSRLFHVPGCPFIHDKASERNLTAKEAILQGYAPCSRCLRQYLKAELKQPAGSQSAGAAAILVSNHEDSDENDREELITKGR